MEQLPKKEGEATYGTRQPNLPTRCKQVRGPSQPANTQVAEGQGEDFTAIDLVHPVFLDSVHSNSL